MSQPDCSRARVCPAARDVSFLLFTIVFFGLISRDAGAQSLPTGWAAADVGSPALSGRSSYTSGVFAVEGGGADVWGSSDQFRYVYRRLSGDLTVVARVGAIENTDAWAKAGVMIRESLSAGSRHAFALVSPSGGLAFQRRRSTGGSSLHTGVSGKTAVWLRLVRRGSTITASRSADGTTWSVIGSDTISMSSTVYVGIAVTSHNTSTRATGTFSRVTAATSSALPTGWATRDVGSPSLAGSASYSSGRFTVKGAGANIWDTRDQFRFAYRSFSGDVDVIARVASLAIAGSSSKGGLMIRSSLQADSAHASIFLRGNTEFVFQRRPAAGTSSLHTSGGSATAPVWLKLERRGSVVTAFRSSDGSTWKMIGSQTLTVTSTFYVGLAVTSRNTSALATGVFDQVTVRAPSTTGNTPPTVSLTGPSSGAAYLAPASITISASASDADGAVARVDFYRGSTLLASDTTAPYSVTWKNVPAGSYSLTAVARDNAGASTRSAARGVTVSATPPTQAVFKPSSDHSTVTYYWLEIFTAGATPSTSTPMGTKKLGKPSIVNGECVADIETLVLSLPSGNYFAAVSAVSSAGRSPRSASPTFAR